MDTIFIPTENDFRKWIKEAIKEYFESSPIPEQNTVSEIVETLLTRKEIAGIFRISLVTLHDWMKRGLPSHKQRGRVSAKIALARLSSPLLYYVLTGNDFGLDVNNPQDPKIVVLANNPEKTQIYGAVISLYLNRLFRILPKKDRNPCAIIADEAASIFANGIENFLGYSRGYKMFVYLALQNLNQLRKSYGREQADVIFNLANCYDINHSRNTLLDYAVPASKISRFSSGEFAGVVADNPDQPIKHKAFHIHIVNDPASINAEQRAYKHIPYPDIGQDEIRSKYNQVIREIEELRDSELERIKKDPELAHLLIVDRRNP